MLVQISQSLPGKVQFPSPPPKVKMTVKCQWVALGGGGAWLGNKLIDTLYDRLNYKCILITEDITVR